MQSRSDFIDVKLPDGSRVRVETTPLGGEEEASAFKVPDFKKVTDTIESVANAMAATLQKISPKRAAVEFGVEVGLESGELTTLLVKGTGKSTFKVTLEWGESNK